MTLLRKRTFVCVVLLVLCSVLADNSTNTAPSVPIVLPAKTPGQMEALLPLLLNQLDVNSLMPLLTSLMSQFPGMLSQGLEARTDELSEKTYHCLSDINTYIKELLEGKLWALSMLDATGKLGPSLLQGSLTFMGNFDQCLESVSPMNQTTGKKIEGDTCVAYFTPPPQMASLLQTENTALLPATVSLIWHLCVPTSCDNTSLAVGLQDTLSQFNMTVTRVVCHNDITSGPIGQDSAAVGVVVLMSILGWLLLLGTAFDLYLRTLKGDSSGNMSMSESKPNQSNAIKSVNSSSLNGNSKPKNITNGSTIVLTSATFNESSENKTDFGKDGAKESISHIYEVNGPQEAKSVNSIYNTEKALKTAVPDHVAVVDVNNSAPSDFASNMYKMNAHHSNTEVKKSELGNSKAPLWHRVLLCFSAVTNGEKILSVKSTPGSLTCLNGIRVLSMGWVILGHTLGQVLQTTANPRAYFALMTNFTFQTMMNATVSVDSFFVLSGVLVTYLFLRETKKRGRVQPKQMVMYYVHRYLRLTPAYAFMIYVNTSLVPYLTDGPMFTGAEDKEFCKKYWWTDIIYVNNLVNPSEQCAGWGWYLANDMQFYIVAPLAIVPFALGSRHGGKKILRLVGIVVASAYFLIHIICAAYFVHKYNVNMFSGNGVYYEHIYVKPWCRIAPFATGMLAAFFLHKTEGKFKLDWFIQALGWLVSLGILLTVLLVTYDENKVDGNPWGRGARVAYETLSRPAWGLMLAWIIVMCCSGKGGIINTMLSWDWWQPLSRLTYGAYLLHPIIMFLDTASVRTLTEYSVSYAVHRFLGYMPLSFLFSFMMALLVEAPFLQLEKLILG